MKSGAKKLYKAPDGVAPARGRGLKSAFGPGDVVQFEPFVGYEYNEYLFIPFEYIYGVVAGD